MGEIDREVQLEDVHRQPRHGRQQVVGAPAHVQADDDIRPLRADVVDDALLRGEDEAFVVGRAHHRGRRVAHADGVGAGLDLGLPIGARDLRGEVEQLIEEDWISVGVHHQRRQAAHLRRQRQRSLHPAHDRGSRAGDVTHHPDGGDAVEHAARCERVGHAQAGERPFVQQQCARLHDGRPAGRPLHGAVVAASDVDELTRGIGAGHEAVDAVGGRHRQLRLGQASSIGHVVVVVEPGVAGRELHHQRLRQQAVEGVPIEGPAHSFPVIHGQDYQGWTPPAVGPSTGSRSG